MTPAARLERFMALLRAEHGTTEHLWPQPMTAREAAAFLRAYAGNAAECAERGDETNACHFAIKAGGMALRLLLDVDPLLAESGS